MTKEEDVWTDELMAEKVAVEEEPVTLICRTLFLFTTVRKDCLSYISCKYEIIIQAPKKYFNI